MAAHRYSTFSQQQLEKHGWKSGQGLGRTQSGIREAIKVKIKHDTAGVGHDPGEQFTYHWWDHVFNKAASNIVVENDQGIMAKAIYAGTWWHGDLVTAKISLASLLQDGVKLSRKEDHQGLISNKKRSKDSGKKPLLYGNFVKSATLTPSGLQRDGCDSSSSSSEEEDGSLEETNIDEKFFKACGGRTAHKGARHGLTLSGKLKRIQEQEDTHAHQHLKDHYTQNKTPSLPGSCMVTEIPSDKDGAKKSIEQRKKRRKDKKCNLDDRPVDASCSDLTTRNVSDCATRDGKPCLSGDEGGNLKKKKKSKRKKAVENGDIDFQEYAKPDESCDVREHTRTKEHKRKRTTEKYREPMTDAEKLKRKHKKAANGF